MPFIIITLFCLCCIENSLYSQDQLSSDLTQHEEKNFPKNHAVNKSTPEAAKENFSFMPLHNLQDKNLSKIAQTQPGSNSEKKEDSKEKSPHKLTGSVAFLSDYRSRGLSQTFRHAAAQAELKYTHICGFYFKSWGSNVDGTSHFINNTSLEWDQFIGIQRKFPNTEITYDVGLLYYYYPGGKAEVPANIRYNTLEGYVAWEYKKLEFKLSVTLTDYFASNSSNPPTNWRTNRVSNPNGSSFGSPYLEINYEYSFYSKWKAAAHVGYQGVVNYPQLSYFDWLMSVTREFEWFEVVLTYVQTNARKDYYSVPDDAYHPHRVSLGGPGVVIAVDRTF